MDGEIEALGMATTAGLAAREFDRVVARGHGHTLTECQNCGAHLAGPFCHACGQSGHVHRTVGHVLEEFAHGILHVDSKGWRTLPMLFLNPGRLTREYVHGRRARYIAPFALFLFAFFIMFLAFGLGGSVVGGNAVKLDAQNRMTPAEKRAALADIDADLAKTLADPAKTPDERRGAETAAVFARGVVESRARGDPQVMSVGQAVRAAAKDAKVDLGVESWNSKARKALANPELAIYKVEQKAYKLLFLLVPLSVPLLWLLFAARREATLYDHTVFVLYSLAFMSLFVVVVIAVSAVLRTVPLEDGAVAALVTAALFVPPIHLYAQLKGAYGLSRRGALWRTALLVNGAIIVVAAYFALMIVLGMVG